MFGYPEYLTAGLDGSPFQALAERGLGVLAAVDCGVSVEDEHFMVEDDGLEMELVYMGELKCTSTAVHLGHTLISIESSG